MSIEPRDNAASDGRVAPELDEIRNSILFNVVAVDPSTGNDFGSGHMIGETFGLTAQHVIGDGVNDGRIRSSLEMARLDQDSDGPQQRTNPSEVNTVKVLSFGSDTNELDMSLFKTGGQLIDDDVPGEPEAGPSNSTVIGFIVFHDPFDAVEMPVTTAGYPNLSAGKVLDPSGYTMYKSPETEGSGTIELASKSTQRFYFSDGIDAINGQSGSGIWVDISEVDSTEVTTFPYLADVEGDLIAAIYTGANGELAKNRGTRITPDIYRQITEEMETGAGSSAADLPENVIVGTTSNDVSLQGSYRRELILGRSSNDTLIGGGGDDRLYGGPGQDWAIYSEPRGNYNISIPDLSETVFNIVHLDAGPDGTDETKGVEFAQFPEDDGTTFTIPLKRSDEDPTQLADGVLITAEDEFTTDDGSFSGTILVTIPAYTFDGNVNYSFSIGSEQELFYNIAYIIDSSFSMSLASDPNVPGSPTRLDTAREAYIELTEALIDQGVTIKEIAIVDFDQDAMVIDVVNAQDAIDVLQDEDVLSADGTETDFGLALEEAETWFESNETTGSVNIAWFLSDGINTQGSGASPSLQTINEGEEDETTVEVRAFGIGSSEEQLEQLTIIDSDAAEQLTDPEDLIEAFQTRLSKDSIDSIVVKVDGDVVDTIDGEQLNDDNPLALTYNGTLEGLTFPSDGTIDVTFEVVFVSDVRAANSTSDLVFAADVEIENNTSTVTLPVVITNGQNQFTQPSDDGTEKLVTFGVLQSEYTSVEDGTADNPEDEVVNANDLDNTIDAGGGTNEVFGNGGNDRFIISGGVNVIDGGDGIDVALFSQTLADAGGVTKNGNLFFVGDDNVFSNMEFLEFSDIRLNTRLEDPDADPLEEPRLTVTQPSTAISEADAGAVTADFILNLSHASTQAIEVSFATRDGRATSDSDFASATGTIIFDPGETQKTISVDILPDELVETNETFFVDLSIAQGATFADGGTSAVAAAEIEDDDTAIGLVTRGGQGTNLIEGSPSSPNIVTFVFERYGDLNGTDTITYSAVGTGSNPAGSADIVGGFPSGTLEFQVGESVKTIDIEIAPDWEDEPDETFVMTLARISGSASVPADATVFTILNDDEGINRILGTPDADGLNGTAGRDVIEALGGDDVVVGNGGDDSVLAGDGDDSIVAGSMDGNEDPDGDDLYDGGDGNDTVSYEDVTEDIVVDFEDDSAYGAQIGDDTLTDTENVFGGWGNDSILGDTKDNVLCGNDGHDFIDGADGDDTLIGGGGDDTIDGGTGDDLIYGDSTAGIGDVGLTVRFDSESAGLRNTYGVYNTETGKAHIIVANVDVDTNPSLAYLITGLPLSAEEFNNLGFFLIPDGYDRNLAELEGGDPSDLRLEVFDDKGVWKIRDADSGYVFSGANDATYFTDPALNPGGLDHTRIVGELGANGQELQAWEDLPNLGDKDFDDTIFHLTLSCGLGLPGSDLLVGGEGNDTIYGNEHADTLQGGTGDDSLMGNAGDDSLEGGDGMDTLRGSTGDDSVDGAAGGDELHGGSGDDMLDGGIGDDNLKGGGGSDQFFYRPGFDFDRVWDFDGLDDNEQVVLQGFGFTDFESDVAPRMRQVGNAVHIDFTDFGTTDVLQLGTTTSPVLIGDLGANDFVLL